MELRGFDSYPIMLGDEMRGERASLGKSLEDAERDLRIKKRMIVAIENCDLEGFPNRSVVAGYVRSYARYLGMDPEDCYQRFCAESGYQSPVAMMAQQASGSRPLPLLPVGTVAAEIAHSRFAAPPARSRLHGACLARRGDIGRGAAGADGPGSPTAHGRCCRTSSASASHRSRRRPPWSPGRR